MSALGDLLGLVHDNLMSADGVTADGLRFTIALGRKEALLLRRGFGLAGVFLERLERKACCRRWERQFREGPGV